MTEPLLQVSGLGVAYGGIQAVKGIDLTVMPGELVALIGANGAGKTTTLKAITGALPWSAGEVRYRGESIRGLPAHRLVERGLAMVPEGRGVFARMSITENLLMGAYTRRDSAGIARDVERMFGIFPRLKERARQLAGTLSGGERQMLALGRALMARPRLLLLDEPSLGLAPRMVREIFHIIADLKRMNFGLNPLSGEAVGALVSDVSMVAEDLLPDLRDAYSVQSSR
jgi:branched-chain amino acid transport system ATP-binding protein